LSASAAVSASGKQISQLQPGQLARFRVRIYLR
jgi:hypothetical protein